MKVNNISNLYFRGTDLPKNSVSNSVDEKNQINSISNVTPDYSVKIPQKYTKIKEYILSNGQEIHTYKLSNGYKVTIVPMEGSPAVVKTYVNVGSLNETQDIKGISHFLEHMAFNGTNGENGHMELNIGDSFKKIDKLGGWANASTNYAITDYVNSSPLLEKEDLETQIKVLSAMTEDLKLSEEMIKKEKGPVSSEINMIMDDPQTIAMDQTVRTLYNIKNPADELVGGSVKHIQNLTREDVLNYYNKYYTPDNTNIVITGDVNLEETIELIAKNFVSDKTSKGKKFEENLSPIQSTVRKDFISDKANSTEIVLGFAGAKNNNTRDKVLYDMSCEYLASQSSGLEKCMKEYNAVTIIADDKISTNPNSSRLGYIMYSTSDANCEKSLRSLLKILSKNNPINEENLKIIKQHLINNKERSLEKSVLLNDSIGKAVLDNDIEYVTEYNKIIESVTPEELNDAVKRFFDINKAAITVVHPKSDNNISFKGNSNRQPINMSKVDLVTLPNNIEIGCYKAKTNNIDSNIKFITDVPYNRKPAVTIVLDQILNMGIKDKMNEDEYKEYLEKNNLSLDLSSSGRGISININSYANNYEKGLNITKEILKNPAITEENINKAKKIIKDSLERQQDTAYSLYSDFSSKTNPYRFTKDEVLEFLDTVTTDDVKDCYDYIMKNSRAVAGISIPENNSEVKENTIKILNTFNPVKENKYKELERYTEDTETKILTKANNNSQADVLESFKFKFDNSLKNIIAGNVMNSILTSSSIGLFDILREKENLAYSVHSEFDIVDNEGFIHLNILTTTDNKIINDVNYDNLQKSINGFNRQIKALTDGDFTEQDLENAKRSLKAELLNNEGSYVKINALTSGMSSKYGADCHNQIFKEIDNLTKEDVIKFAKTTFSSKPIYSIVASQDTLDYNKNFLKSLKTR